jgi:hypothetical protein
MYVTGVVILTSIFLCTQRTRIYRYVKRKVALAKASPSYENADAADDEIKTKIRVLPRYVQHMHAMRPSRPRASNIRTV